MTSGRLMTWKRDGVWQFSGDPVRIDRAALAGEPKPDGAYAIEAAADEARLKAFLSEQVSYASRVQTAATELAAEAERNRLNADAEAERARLEAESAARRALADEDFEIALRERRSRENEAIETARAEAHAEAERIVSEARATAEQMVADATSEVRRLHAHRDETHAVLRELHSKLQAALDESLAETPPS